MSGKLIIFSAPSGSGKTTIVHEILKREKDLFEFSISVTTRQKRPKETDGEDYYFMCKEDFQKKIDEDAFVEWEMVYDNCYYGTLKSEVERIWKKGKHVLFDVDVMGGISIKKQYGDRALSIFIEPPSIEELRKRLELRQTESPESLEMRIEKAKEEMEYAKQFDVIIVNEDLDKAIEETHRVIREFLNK